MTEDIKDMNKQIETAKRYKRFPEIFGVYFSVKVDESSSIISPENFKFINENIYYDKLDNGNWGYFIGIFNYYEAASAFRRDMIEQGYKDAIIIAYNNGKRILIDEALALVEKSFATKTNSSVENKKIIKNPSEKKDTLPTPKSELKKLSAQKTATSTLVEKKQISATPATNKKNISTKNKSENAASENIEYRIQIIASKTPVPSNHSVYKTFQNIHSEKGDDGYYRYYTGLYATLESAISGRKKVMDKGAKEALVVAFQNKKRISLAEAQRILGNSK